MQTLLQTLQDRDAGHLRIIAELWGLELPPGAVDDTRHRLVMAMLDPQSVAEMIDGLSANASQALNQLLLHQGRLPFGEFNRLYGPLRAMGPGRRDREKPWRQPASALESLWYRGLFARAFIDTASGAQEFSFIPDDLRRLLPNPPDPVLQRFGQAAAKPAHVSPGRDFALDDATSLLAALRRRAIPGRREPGALSDELAQHMLQPRSSFMLLVLLLECDLLEPDALTPRPEAVRHFLNLPRPEALRQLQQAWWESKRWNDLAQLSSHLASARDNWPNDPWLARQAFKQMLEEVPNGTWWSLSAFIQSVREHNPGFQRPAGDFSVWYLQSAGDNRFLQGLEHWDSIEGHLLRALFSGPLYWLGIIDLGFADQDGPIDCFRLKPPHEQAALGSQSDSKIKPDVQVHAEGSIIVPRTVGLALRYQIARACAWEGQDERAFRYRLTPDSLAAAREEGLQPTHIRTVLTEASGDPLPPPIEKSLRRWTETGTEARLERVLILRVKDPAVLERLRQKRETGRFLGQPLGPTTVLVREQDWLPLIRAAVRQGLLLQPPE